MEPVDAVLVLLLALALVQSAEKEKSIIWKFDFTNSILISKNIKKYILTSAQAEATIAKSNKDFNIFEIELDASIELEPNKNRFYRENTKNMKIFIKIVVFGKYFEVGKIIFSKIITKLVRQKRLSVRVLRVDSRVNITHVDARGTGHTAMWILLPSLAQFRHSVSISRLMGVGIAFHVASIGNGKKL